MFEHFHTYQYIFTSALWLGIYLFFTLIVRPFDLTVNNSNPMEELNTNLHAAFKYLPLQ